MTTSTALTVEQVKDNGQDFEWYPTTDEIIFSLLKNIPHYVDNGHGYSSHPISSFMDIGAGNGKVLSAIKNKFEHIDLYAIEKSAMLRAAMDKEVYIVGTDFLEQSLIDKSIDVTFCNPPYSEFECWAEKIIRESSSQWVFLVLPVRWKDSETIKAALKYRDASFMMLGEFDFNNAERQARARVNLISISLSCDNEDAFNREFSGIFPNLTEKMPGSSGETFDHKSYAERTFGHLVTGKGFVKSLVELYQQDIARIKRNYEAVGKLDADVLRELDTTLDKVRTLLLARLKGLKSLYWKELISRMGEITSRLIGKRRQKLLDQLNTNGSVDFTEGNVYAVILWILKHANGVIDEQLIEIYEQMIEKANIHNYKSNSRVYEFDRWRYNQEKPTHIYLDYRLVLTSCGRISKKWTGKEYKLSESACEYIRDLLTIAHNLGFECDTGDDRLRHYETHKYWSPGQAQTFTCTYKGKYETVFEIRAHLNGNIHLRMNQELALALNVEYGRLKGWLHSKGQAAEEIKDPKAGNYFNSNIPLLPSQCLMLEDFSS